MRVINTNRQGYSCSSEVGATLIEYAIAFAALAVVFLGAVTLLREASETAGNRSTAVVHDMVPCIKTGAAYSVTCVKSPECFTDQGLAHPDCDCCFP